MGSHCVFNSWVLTGVTSYFPPFNCKTLHFFKQAVKNIELVSRLS